MKSLILVLCLLAPTVARAEFVDVPLSGLHGDYDPGCAEPNEAPASRIMTFTLPVEVVSVSHLRMKVSGLGSGGAAIIEREISGTTYYDTLYYPADVRLLLTAPALGEDWFLGVVGVPEPSVIDATSLLNGGPNGWVDPNLLLGQTITAEMYMQFNPCQSAWYDPLTSLTEVSLELEAVTVPAEARLWDNVKALFR